jgi:hypothetical protein
MKHLIKTHQNLIAERRSPTFPRVRGLTMIDASFGIAVPRTEAPLDAPAFGWESWGRR